MVDVQSVTAENRRGKKEDRRRGQMEETTGQKYNGLPCPIGQPQIGYSLLCVECGSYGGIKLLEHAMKVAERIFEHRIRRQHEVDDAVWIYET